MKINKYEEEIRGLEEELTPSRIWGREISDGQWELLEQQLSTALFLVDEVEATVNSRNAPGSTDMPQTQTAADASFHVTDGPQSTPTPAATIASAAVKRLL